MEPIKVLLADDHTIFRSGLRALIEMEDDLVVVGEAGSGEEAAEKVLLTSPDVVVMDLDMPGAGGLEATRVITGRSGAPRVLILSSQPEAEIGAGILGAGGSGYVHKRSAEDEVMRAIRVVAGGEAYFHKPQAHVVRSSAVGKVVGGQEPKEGLGSLSERELEVLTLCAEGFSSAEIGKKLVLSPKTVETYRLRMMLKLGATHRSELVRLALKHGLLKG